MAEQRGPRGPRGPMGRGMKGGKAFCKAYVLCGEKI